MLDVNRASATYSENDFLPFTSHAKRPPGVNFAVTASRKLLPDWISAYPKQALGADVLAGVIVAVLVVPQSLAYALLAGLPPQAGLYASIFPVMAYALLGSSRVQAVGPVAITAIMTFATLAPLAPMAPPGSAQYVQIGRAHV